MGCAIGTDKTRAIQCECHIKILQGDVVNELIIGSLQKCGIDGDDRFESFASQSGSESHGMLFRDFDGKLLYVVHHAEGDGPRKPQLWNVDDSGDKLVLKDRIILK